MKHPLLLLYLAAIAASPSRVIVAQQPGALPPSVDPEIWGCRNHPFVATVLVVGSRPDQVSQQDQNHSQQEQMYRDAAGTLRTDSFYDSGAPMTILLKSPTAPVVTMLKVVDKAAFELPAPFPDRSQASETWRVSALPGRKILGLDTVGFRYIRTLHTKADSSEAPTTIVEDAWFSPTACMVLERHVTNSAAGSVDERVVRLEQREPDPKLFEIPSEYLMHKAQSQ